MSPSTKPRPVAGATPIRFPRGRRTGWSVITAVVLLAIAVAGGYLAVVLALHRTVNGVDLSRASRWLRDTGYRDQTVLICGIVLAGVGIALLLVALAPAPRHLVELTGPDAHTAAALPQASLRRTVQSAARRIDGISRASARIGRRRIGLDVVTGLRHTDGLAAGAEAAATDRLAALELRRPRIVKTRLIRKES